MAYDLSSFYTNNLSANSLSKTIIDQMMANNRFSSVSKISLPGLNYSSGSASSTPIGYTETGRPIYEQNVGITMNDELKDALAKKHERNTDSMLRNIGSTVLENTSTGNIAAFISQGVIKAFITEDGRFTGKIRLENIEDLSTMSLDTSNFYNKSDITSLLAGKLSKSYLFDATNKIKSDFIASDIVRKTEFDPHYSDSIRHLTGLERSAWNAKYDKPADGIPMKDLSKEVSNRINTSATKGELDSHTNNLEIHTSTIERAKWNAKYDKPATGVPMSDLSEIVQNNINSSAKASTLVGHMQDTIAHVTAEERTKWNGRYQKPDTGVPMTDLDKSVQSTINNAVSNSTFAGHTNNSSIHVTADERTKWNGNYAKPSTGVPLSDLETSVQTAVNNSATKTELGNHTANATVHIKQEERDTWNAHKVDAVAHITGEERSKWNAKYDKPANGIPETDLNAGLATKINGMVSTTDFVQHSTDSIKHITQTEREGWNSKYQKPTAGIPEKDLDSTFTDKVAKLATSDALKAHTDSTAIHTSDVERAKWNAKYDKPSAGIPETDLAQSFRDKVATLATTSALTAHVSDNVKHITAGERATWNSKYGKPASGIPATDLEASVQTKISASALNEDLIEHVENDAIHVTPAQATKIANAVSSTDLGNHTNNSAIHITDVERTKWNGNYAKPQAGIPLADLVVELQNKLNAVAVPYTKTISIGTTTVTITASEHAVVHANGFEYGVTAYKLNGDFYETVAPSLVRVNDTTKDIEVQFASAFAGKLVVR